MGRQVALGVVALVRVGSTPLEARGGQFVGCQGAGARCKTGIKVLMFSEYSFTKIGKQICILHNTTKMLCQYAFY